MKTRTLQHHALHWLVIAAIVTGLQCNLWAQGAWTILETYTIPGKASGLAWDGTYIYYGIYGSGGSNFYRFDPASGQATLLFNVAGVSNSYGMTHDGNSLWIIDRASTGNAYALNISMTGTVLGQFSLPQQYMSGIAWDNGDFWVASYYPDPGWIYKVNAQSTVLHQFAPPMAQTWDLARHGSDLWVVDYNGNMIFKTDLNGNVLASYPSVTQRPSGIVHTGSHLWYVAGPLSANSTLYKVDPGGAGTPQAMVTPTSVSFGNVLTGQTHNQNITVTNAGTGTLNFSFAQPPQNTNVMLPSGNFSLEAGQSATYVASWTPLEPGTLSTTGAVLSNDPINPNITLNFSGQAYTAAPSINAFPTSIDFGTIMAMSTKMQNITLTNQGQATLIISAIENLNPGFYLQLPAQFPIQLEPNQTMSFNAWFFPQNSNNYQSSVVIFSNAPGQSPLYIPMTGQATPKDHSLGNVVWDLNLPPATDNSPKAIHWITDITGDNKPEVVVASEDNKIRCFNGNASGTSQVLWELSIYSGSLYQQQAITLGGDIDDDGIPDLVVGTAWGDRSVVAINSRTGEIIWKFQTNQYGLGGWVYQVDARYDYNGDGFPDVLASSGNDQNGTGPKRVFCLNGKNGQMIWNYAFTGPVIAVMGIPDVTGDGQPDVWAGGSQNGESQGRVALINGATGFLVWDYVTLGTSVWGLALLDDLNNDGKPELAAGTFNGVVYIFNAANGAVLAQTSVGSNIITRLVRMEDVNGDGKADLALGYSGSLAMILNGTNLQQIWTYQLQDKPWNVARIPDVSGDGINDLVVGLLYQNNHVYVFDGATGSMLFTTPYPQAVDAISTVPDLTFDYSWEFVAGGRTGKVTVFAGGPGQPVGLPAQVQENEWLKVYPNPFSSHTHISIKPASTGQLLLNLYDLSGKIVWNKSLQAVQNNETVVEWNGSSRDGNKLRPSVYILEALSGNRRMIQKIFIKED
ncbi:MAG: VCBS repeat-containing protein [Bacteroidetes bacterium]|nr:VCBS repeat-containing protein [Bacteroidota bacterium]